MKAGVKVLEGNYVLIILHIELGATEMNDGNMLRR
jgi:hypothetical protein